LPTGGGGGAGGGAALGGELGGIADTVGFPVLPLFEVLLEGPHMATANAMAAMTAARIANVISRGLTGVLDIDISPIVRFAFAKRVPHRSGSHNRDRTK
jgi:hypothetical protein